MTFYYGSALFAGGLIALLAGIFDLPERWQWYRRARGGRWARVTGWLYGKRWVRVGPACVERVDEDWTGISGACPQCEVGRVSSYDFGRALVCFDCRASWRRGAPLL